MFAPTVLSKLRVGVVGSNFALTADTQRLLLARKVTKLKVL